MLYAILCHTRAIISNCHIIKYSICNILSKHRQITESTFHAVKKKKNDFANKLQSQIGIEVVLVPINSTIQQHQSTRTNSLFAPRNTTVKR